MMKRNTSNGYGSFAPVFGRAKSRPRTLVLLLFLVSICGAARVSHAQALPAAEKGGGLDAFGAFTLTRPDYGPPWNKGGSAGVEFLVRKFIFGQPGASVRYFRTTGSVTETFIGGGLESHYQFGNVRPYLTALYGVGGLSLPQYNYSDSGNEFLIGGGADYPLTRKFEVRGEFLYGFVNITGYHNTSVGAINITPATINIGVVYHIK